MKEKIIKILEEKAECTINGHADFDNVDVTQFEGIAEEIVKLCNLHFAIGSLPSLDDAAKVAVRISEEAIKPPLDAKEQAMFIAGFQECIKWLNVVFSNDS